MGSTAWKASRYDLTECLWHSRVELRKPLLCTYHPLSMALKCAAGLHIVHTWHSFPLALYACFAAKKEDFEYFAPNILPYFVDKGKCGVWHNFWRRVITQCPNTFQVNKEVNLVIFQINSILHQLILKKAIAALMKSILNWIISIEFLISARALFDRAVIRYTHTERKYTAEPRGEDVPEIGKWIGRRSGSGRSAQPSSSPSRLLAQGQGQGKHFQIVNGKQVFSIDSCLPAARVFVTTHFWADLTFQNTYVLVIFDFIALSTYTIW